MTYQEVLENARKNLAPRCRVCRECDGRACRGEVPGASPRDCGNYLDMNLGMANYLAERYLAVLENITDDRLVYPE